MCIIAAIPAGKQISKETLNRCWQNNPHGGGFMYSDGKKVVTHKEMSSFKRYWKAFVAAKEAHQNSGFVCHFRISTHGKINETNCHPFLINQQLGFAHNGIIYAAPNSNDYSDTYMFNEVILKNLPKNFLANTAIVSMIAEYIGRGSKLAFLNWKGDISLVNEKAGTWDDGIWYSNSGYKAANYFDYGGTKSTSVYGTAAVNTTAKTTAYTAPAKTKKFSDCELPFPKPYQSYRTSDTMPPTCEFCAEHLVTSSERINGVCNHCFQEILEEDRIAKIKSYSR